MEISLHGPIRKIYMENISLLNYMLISNKILMHVIQNNFNLVMNLVMNVKNLKQIFKSRFEILHINQPTQSNSF